MEIEADDRDGMMLDVATVMTSARAKITTMSAKPIGNGMALISLSFPVHDLAELENIRNRLRGISGVKNVRRGNG